MFNVPWSTPCYPCFVTYLLNCCVKFDISTRSIVRTLSQPWEDLLHICKYVLLESFPGGCFLQLIESTSVEFVIKYNFSPGDTQGVGRLHVLAAF